MMDKYEKFMQILNEIRTVSDEMKKSWNSDASVLFFDAFDDSADYIEKTAEKFQEELKKCTSSEDRVSAELYFK